MTISRETVESVVATILIDASPDADVAEEARCRQQAARIVDALGVMPLLICYGGIKDVVALHERFPDGVRDVGLTAQLRQLIDATEAAMRS